MNRRVVLITAAAAAAAPLAAWGLFSRDRARREQSRAVAELFGGEPGLETVARPERVEACRLGQIPAGRTESGASVFDYPVISGPREVPPAISAPISAALLSPATYGWEFSKSCVPSYGVRLSFHHGDDRVDVLLCFECDVLLISRNGRTTGGEDFDSGRPIFVQAVKAIFPEDELIRRLPEVRSGR